MSTEDKAWGECPTFRAKMGYGNWSRGQKPLTLSRPTSPSCLTHRPIYFGEQRGWIHQCPVLDKCGILNLPAVLVVISVLERLYTVVPVKVGQNFRNEE
jgi:hypothetical protein